MPTITFKYTTLSGNQESIEGIIVPANGLILNPLDPKVIILEKHLYESIVRTVLTDGQPPSNGEGGGPPAGDANDENQIAGNALLAQIADRVNPSARDTLLGIIATHTDPTATLDLLQQIVDKEPGESGSVDFTETNTLLTAVSSNTAKIPAVGSKADSASLPVTKSTEDKAATASTNAKLDTVIANLGEPLQEGGSVSVTNLPTVQPVSASTLPLPAGAATSALQTSIRDDIVAALGEPLQEGGAVSVSNFPAIQPVSVTALPLPTGAATAALQSAIISAIGAPLQAGGSVSVSNFPVTQPISATVLPLPTGAASSVKQSDGSQITQISGSAGQAAAGISARVNPFGSLQVLTGGSKIMADPFDTVLDTTANWTLSGTNLPVASGAAAVLGLGTGNSLSSVMVSQKAFDPPSVSPYQFVTQINVGIAQSNPNTHRFAGMGVVTGFSASNPVTDGFGFEVDLTGALNVVVYVAGVRYVVNSTNPALITAPGSWATGMFMGTYGQTMSWPANGLAVVQMQYFNGVAYWFMVQGGGLPDVPIGFALWIPNVVSLPVRFASITASSGTVLATTFNPAAFILSTTGSSIATFADPTYPWRQAGVNITHPLGNDGALNVRQTPSDIFRLSFADAYANSVDPQFVLYNTGAGMTVNQTGGNLVITAGTTLVSETLMRSVRWFRGALSLRFKATLSQRIVNNNFIVELADLVGENLSYVINSTTSVTVTFPSVNPFTSANVGQSVNVGGMQFGTGIPGRYAIASVSGLNVNLTVAGWPGSGSGTMVMYGWNYLRANYNGTVATVVGFDTQRRGYNTGDTALTTVTSASPGHMIQIQTDNAFVDFSDSLVASAATPGFTARGSRLENIPDDNIALYLFIRANNGAAPPATSTTFTLGAVHVELTGNHKVMLQGVQNSSANRAVPISGTVNVTGTLTGVTTVTTVTTVTSVTTVGTLSNGQTAHSAAATGNPVRVGGRVAPAAIDTTLISGDATDMICDLNGAQIIKQYSAAAFDWNYVSPPSGIVNSSTPVPIKGAPGASLRNFITSVELGADALGAATEIAIRDGAIVAGSQTIAANTLVTPAHGLSVGDVIIPSASTVTGLNAGSQYYVLTVPSTTSLTLSATPGGTTLAISGTGVGATFNHYLWRQKLQTAGLPTPIMLQFATPLKGGVNQAQEIVALSAVTGGIYSNVRGYVSM